MSAAPDDYPEWTDEPWAKAKQGAPWEWDRQKMRDALDAILKALDARDTAAARTAAQNARDALN